MDKNSLAQLIEVSHVVGANREYVQASGGNTSVESPDGRTMAIKASGIALTLMSETNGRVDREPIRSMRKRKAGMPRVARKLLAGLCKKEWVLLVILVLIAGIAVLLLRVETRQPADPFAPTVSAAFPSQGGADRDAFLETIAKVKGGAFDLFLLGSLLIVGTTFLVLEFNVLKRVCRIVFRRPPRKTRAVKRTARKNALPKRPLTPAKQPAETLPNTEDARKGPPADLAGSLGLRRSPAPSVRACWHSGFGPSPTALDPASTETLRRAPGSRASCFSARAGSSTAQDRPLAT